MKAFKLMNTPDGHCTFIEGEVPEMTAIKAHHFLLQGHTGDLENDLHPAPRYQFVITLKGKLRFTVSNGSSFIIEPGIILIAADVAGEGHSWELIEGHEWQRVYIVLPPGGNDWFGPNKL
jgi:hypothetical protein